MRILLILVVVTLICNCSKKTEVSRTNVMKENMEEEAKRYENLAMGICDCSKDLITMLKDIQRMEDEKRKGKYKELKEKFDAETEESEICIQKLKQENSEENEMDEILMENALKEYCNDFYSMLKVGRVK